MKTSKFFFSTLIAAAAMTASAYGAEYTWTAGADYTFEWDFSQVNTQDGQTGVLGGTVSNTFVTDNVTIGGKDATALTKGEIQGQYWETNTNSFLYDAVNYILTSDAGASLTFTVDYYYTGAQWGENILHIGKDNTGIALGLSGGYVSLVAGTGVDANFSASKTGIKLEKDTWTTITWTLTGDGWSASVGDVSSDVVSLGAVSWDSTAESRNQYSIGIKAPGNINGATGLNDSLCKVANLSISYVGAEIEERLWNGGVTGNWADATWGAENLSIGNMATVRFDSSTTMSATSDVALREIIVDAGATLTLSGEGVVSSMVLTGEGGFSISEGATLAVTEVVGEQNQIRDFSTVSGEGILSVALNTGNGQGVHASDFKGTLYVSGNGRLQLNATTLESGASLEFSDGADMVLNGEMEKFSHGIKLNGSSEVYLNSSASSSVELSGAISGGTLILQNTNAKTLNLSGAVSLDGLTVSANKTVNFTGDNARVTTVTLNGNLGGSLTAENLYLAGGAGIVADSNIVATNAKATGGTSSISSSLDLSGSLWVAGATLNLESGANVAVSQLRMAEQGASVLNINSGASLTVEGSENSYGTSASLLISHWAYNSALNLNGGVLNAENAEMKLSWAGTGTFSAQSGEARLSGLNFWAQSGPFKGHFILGAESSGDAKVYLGSSGIKDAALSTDNEGNALSSIVLGNGTLGATDSWSTAYNGYYTPLTIQLIGTKGGTVFDTEDPVDATGHTITINHAMAGDGKLVKKGAGTLKLMRENTYTGGTTVENGTLAVTANNALGKGSLTMNGGELQVAASTVQELGDRAQIAFNGGKITGEGTLSLGANSTVSVADQKGGSIASEIAIQGNTTLSAGASATLKLSGDVSGSGSLVIEGVGYVELSGNNTYSGGTIVRSSHFVVKEISALGKGTITVEDGGALFLEKAGTIKNLQNSSSYMVHLGKTVNSSGTGDVEDTLTSETTWTIEVDSELVARSGVINGSIGRDSYEGFHSLEKTGDGVFSITGIGEEQSGAVLVKSLNVQAGTLELVSGASALGWEGYANVSIASGAKLQIVAGANAIGAGDVTLADGAKLIIDLSKVAADADSITLGIVSSSAITFGETVLNGLTRSSEVILPEGYVSFVNSDAFSEYAKSWSYDGSTLSLTLAIPEPSMFGLLAGLGALALAGTRRRRK